MSSFRQFCVVHTLRPFGMSKCFEWIGVFLGSQKVGRRFWPPFEKLRGDVKLIWHPLLFRFFSSHRHSSTGEVSFCRQGASTHASQIVKAKVVRKKAGLSTSLWCQRFVQISVTFFFFLEQW